jgi:O-antigen ligase
MFTKSNFAIICIFGMFVGFLFSRAALSISMFLFGFNAIRDVHPREWLRNKWWLVAVVWIIIYALTYFWSEDKANWYVHFQQKFPFLLLPLALPFLPTFSPKQLQTITLIVGSVLLVSACYSMSFFIIDPVTTLNKYHVGDVLPTLPKYDHIRISLAVALFVVWGVYVWPLIPGRKAKWAIGIIMGILVVYLHVIAVKSGLISLYLFLAGWGIYLAFTRQRIMGIMVIIAIPLFAAFAIEYIPTFHERERYIDFTYFMFKHGDKSGNFGDVNRLMSYKIALIIIAQHPLIGIGGGDMMPEMQTGFKALYPEVKPESVILPHNQFLDVGLSCGIPAMLLFTVWIFMPLLQIRRNRQSFFFFIIWLLLFLQLMVEPALEVQFGVFVFLYFLLMQWNELPVMAINKD